MGLPISPASVNETGEVSHTREMEVSSLKEVILEKLSLLKVGVNGVNRLVGMTDEMKRNEGGSKVDVDVLVSSGKELTDEQVQNMTIDELNAYEQAKWKAEAAENGVEFLSGTDKYGFAKIRDFDGVGLGTKEYKALKNIGLQKGANELRDFLREKNGSSVKILTVEKLTEEEKKNGIENAIKAVVAKGSKEETVLFGVKNGKRVLLSLSDSSVKGSKRYSTDFLSTKAGKSEAEIKDWQVNHDIIFDENGKATSANITVGDEEFYVDKNGKIVGENDVVLGEGQVPINDDIKNVTNGVTNSVKSKEMIKESYIEKYARELNEKSDSQNYFSSYEKGVSNAQETGKNIIVIAVSEHCIYCNNLVEQTLKNPEFRSVDDNSVVIFQDSKNIDSRVTSVAGVPNGTPQSYCVTNNNGIMEVSASVISGFQDVEEYKDSLDTIFNTS